MSEIHKLFRQRARFKRRSFSRIVLKRAGLSDEEVDRISITKKYGIARYDRDDVNNFLENKRNRTYQESLPGF